jgi:flavin reductase (DIM6/NTAB) family NADH-FMN oxidoreductase RutF
MNDAKAFRNALGHFATGVTIVTARSAEGIPAGVTINSFSSLSLDPPLVLWNLVKTAKSFPVFSVATHFSVHVLAAGQQALSELFASSSISIFDHIAYVDGLGNAPLLSGCAATFECAMERCLEGGDHKILIGRVERFSQHPDALPLLFYRGRYVVPGPGGLFSPTPDLAAESQ